MATTTATKKDRKARTNLNEQTRAEGIPAASTTDGKEILTPDERRMARNAALREWRKNNADRVKAYMAEWRAKRKVQQPEQAEQRNEQQLPQVAQRSAEPASTMPTTAARRRPAKAKKTPTSTKAKKAGKV